MSAALIDPRPPPAKWVTKPRTAPLRACEICGAAFVVNKCNASRFCSRPCEWKSRSHDADLVEAARRHWNQGFTAGQIAALLAAEFDRTFTKNAVIGLAHRHGFPALPRWRSVTLTK
jgi:hypothetical protein